MLALDSSRWQELEHAYGSAKNIPELLAQLSNPIGDGYETEPFYTLWSSLCHQGDVYSASYAAVPYLVQAAIEIPEQARLDLIHLPTAIETARIQNRGPKISPDFTLSYNTAISLLPKAIESLLPYNRNENFSYIAAAVTAISCGHSSLAEIILNLSEDMLPELKNWIAER